MRLMARLMALGGVVATERGSIREDPCYGHGHTRTRTRLCIFTAMAIRGPEGDRSADGPDIVVGPVGVRYMIC